MAKLSIATRYAVTPNELVNNPEISFKAKGLFSFIQSKPEDWDFSAKTISEQSREGVDSISEGLRELERAGYLVRSKFKKDTGFWGIEYTLHDTPQNPVPENPLLENPVVENPVLEKPMLENTPNNKNKNLTKQELKKKESNIVFFDEFWNLYPKERRSNRKGCLAKWQKLTADQVQAILADVPVYVSTVREVQFVMLPLTYLNRESWTDERVVTSTSIQKNATNTRVDPRHQIKSY